MLKVIAICTLKEDVYLADNQFIQETPRMVQIWQRDPMVYLKAWRKRSNFLGYIAKDTEKSEPECYQSGAFNMDGITSELSA